jgi:FecR-like protein
LIERRYGARRLIQVKTIMNSGKENKQAIDSNDTLEALLKLAGPEVEISDEVQGRVYANVRGAWEQGSPRRRVLRWALPTALAASALIALALTNTATTPAAIPAGFIVTAAAEGAGPSTGDSIFAGDVIDTFSTTGLSVALRGDISLRVDRATLLTVDSADEFTLTAGRVYIDTGDRGYADRHITVRTPSGSATDVGTQFSVGFESSAMSVAVREGRVDLESGKQTHTAMRGDKITVRPGNAPRFDSVPPSGESWDWAVDLAPPFEIEGRSLLDFLKWASRETGMELNFESDQVRMEAMRPKLRGSIENFTPLEAIAAVMATTSLNHSIDGNTITISK